MTTIGVHYKGQTPKYIVKMLDIEKIIEEFLHLIITTIIGIPTYESFSKIHIKLNLNVASVYSDLENCAGLIALK